MPSRKTLVKLHHRTVPEPDTRPQTLSSVTERHPLAVIQWRADGAVVGWNPAAVRIFGFSQAEVLGQQLSDLLGPQGPPAAMDRMMQALLHDPHGSQAISENCTKAGKIITCEWFHTPLLDAKNQVVGILSMVQDISDRTRREACHQMTEAALKQSKTYLEARVETRTLELQKMIACLEQEQRDRTAAQRALQRSEAKFRGLVENAISMIFEATPDGIFTYISPNFREAMGYAIEEMQGHSFVPFVHPEDLPICAQALQSVISSGETFYGLEYRVRHKTGSWRWHATNMTARRDDRGQVITLLGIANDVSDRKAMESALRHSETQMRRLLENMPVMLDAFDHNGNIIVWNSECERVTGFAAADVINNPHALELLYPDPAARANMLAEWERKGNNFRNWAVDIGCKDGSQRTILWSTISAVLPVAGWSNWSLGIDITEQKQIEAELQRAEQQQREQSQHLESILRELQRTQTQVIQSEKMSALGQLVAGVAHEINNPVNFIHGNLRHTDDYAQNLLYLISLYQRYYPQPVPEIAETEREIDLEFIQQDLPKMLDSMQMGTERIREIVRSLRTFSRLDEAEYKAANLHEGIDSTLMILQSRIKMRQDFPGIQIIRDYGDLPLVFCYAGQLNQVFMNILSNAIDAVEEGFQRDSIAHGQPQIRICTTIRADATAVIQIVDNGVGIPAEVQTRLFDPFFTTKPVGQGTGMGLSISYQIVSDRHKGSLTCHSQVGQGSEFIVEIPVIQALSAAGTGKHRANADPIHPTANAAKK